MAKDLARRSGKTLGEWLNEVIIEGGVVAPEVNGAAPRAEARPDSRLAHEVEPQEDERGPYREVMRDISRHAHDTVGSRQAYREFGYDEPDPYEPRRRPTAALYPEPRRTRGDGDYGGEDLSRVTLALERLSSRIEAAENRSTVAITGIDQSVVNVLTRLDAVERENTSVAARFEGAVEELRHNHRNVHERLRSIEESEQGVKQAEALRSLEAALGKIAGQLYDGEQRTQSAIGEIRQGVREELTQGEYRTRAAVGELREEINDSEQRARAAFAVLREELGERETRIHTNLDQLRDTVAETDKAAREHASAARQDIAALSARVERTEQRQAAAPLLPPRPTPAPEILVDQVVAKVTQRLEEAESKTSEAVRSLQASFAGLDQRLRAAESSPAGDPEAVAHVERRFESLAAELARSVEDARVEMAERLNATADSLYSTVDQARSEMAVAGVDPADVARFESLETAVRELTGHVEAAERRSAEAIERMGREVMRVTEALTARVATVESESAQATERAASLVEKRLDRADTTHAEALDRLGDEMSRISDRLAERVDASERRSAEAIEEVGEKVAGVAERMNEKFERTAESLSERIRQSDERSQRLIEETRERLDHRLGQAERGLSEKLEARLGETQRGISQAVEERILDGHRSLAEKVEARISDTQRSISQAVEARIDDAQRGVVDRVEQRVGEMQRGLTTVEQRLTETHRGLVEQVEQRVGDVQRGLTTSVEQRLAETQRGLVEKVEQRVGDVQRGLAEKVEQRVGDVQRGLAETVEQRVGDVQRGLASSYDLRLSEVQRTSAEIASRMEQAEQASVTARADYSATVFTRPADLVIESDPDLEPFGAVVEDGPAIEAAALEAEPADGFRRTPLEIDIFDAPTTAFDIEPAEIDLEPEARPIAAAAAPAPALEAEAFPAEPFDDTFEVADEFISRSPVSAPVELEPAITAQPEPEPEPEPVPEPAFNSRPDFQAEPAFEAEFEPEPEFKAEPAFQAEPAFVAEPAFKAEPAFVAEPALDGAPLAGAFEPDPVVFETPDFDPPAFEPVSFEPAPYEAPAPVTVKAPEPAPPARSSTRDMLEQARAAAKAAAADVKAKGKAKKVPPLPSVTPKPNGLKDLGPPPPMAGLKTSGLKGPGLGGLLAGLRRSKDEREGGMRTFALVAGTSFAVGLTGAGWALLQRQEEGAPAPDRDRVAQGPVETPLAASLVMSAGKPTPAAAPATGGQAAAYASAVRLIESGDAARGVADLRRIADAGHAPAQFYLAKLYENGEAGLARDAAQARQWTERAAQGGDRKAMHNLALFYFSGDGGERNMGTAATWFRKAADQGLVDSQYNLGRLYEEGFGVATNPSEAYKWYLIAGRAGDAEARTSAERIKRQLTAEAQAAAERSAIAFRSQTAGGARATGGVMAEGEVAAAQRALSELGFYKGPADGRTSPALRRAIAAWQRQQGLAATGAITGDTLARLAAAAG